MANELSHRADHFNSNRDEQQDLVAGHSASARLLVLAGPGTGKTETVAKRLARLVEAGVRPAQILVLSFSRSAVKTVTRRLEKFISESSGELDELRHLSIRTFDSWSFRLLRQLGNSPANLLQNTYNRNIATLVGEMRSANRERVLELLRSVRHIIVDEFQDLSGVRGALVLELLGLLSPPRKQGVGFTVLGDEAQAIYGFSARQEEEPEFSKLTAGELLRKLREVYGNELKTIEFVTNYRSTEKLADMTQALRNILSRSIPGEKKLEYMEKVVARIPQIEGDLTPELVYLKVGESAAVLTRTNGEVLRVSQKLSGYGSEPPSIALVVRMAGRPTGVPAWVGAMLGRAKGNTVTRSQFRKIYDHLFGQGKAGFAESVGMPMEAAAWSSIVYATEAGKDATAIDIATLRDRLDWVDLLPDDEGEPDDGIQVMTIHQSKGMEFDSVAIMEPAAGETPSDTSKSDPTEAANVIFVGVSRAGSSLMRIPARSTHKPLSLWQFQKGMRRRWGDWHHGWINIEIGIPGDIDSVSFVDPEIHGSLENIRNVQELLAANAFKFRGQKVMLCKRAMHGEERKFIYGIHLQSGKEPGLLLGETTTQLTFDLLSRLHGANHQYSLPQSIFNLRIAEVVTTTVTAESTRRIADDWTQSRLWLGVSLFGTGDFPTRKWNGK